MFRDELFLCPYPYAERNSLDSLETPNMMPAAVKININNRRDNQYRRRK